MPKSTMFMTICTWPRGWNSPPMTPKLRNGSPPLVMNAGMMVWKGRLPGA